MAQVRDIVDGRELFFAEVQHTVAEVARQMAALKVGAILVLRNGELCGVFSERDLLTRVVVPSLDPANTTVDRVMTSEVATVEEDATLEEAMARMHSHKCRHLPVVRGKAAVGFISMRDLMSFDLARKTEELDRMRAYIHGSE